ncbi:hypothetical protein EMMF5_006498 [Cystobasidiomycetes sp. EMM_F5]
MSSFRFESVSFRPISQTAKGKQAAAEPSVTYQKRRSVAGSPIESSYASSEYDDEEYYFSDASTSSGTSTTSASSSASKSSVRIGDFILDDEDLQSYLARDAQSAQPDSSKPRTSKKVSKSTRKGSSAFFMSSSSFSPLVSSRVAAQNPNLKSAGDALSRKVQALVALSDEPTLDTSDDHRHFERALMFANFVPTRQGSWEAPVGANKRLQRLIEQL